MKKLFVFLLGCTAVLTARADEGMWLPSLIGQTRLAAMQAKGLALSAEDIYSINHASLKDAVVRFNGGCTGELISDEGLLITNHHCGYDQVQAHSSVEHDYLTNGFWAMSRAEELPNKGLVVTFLVRMEDVTAQALEGVTPEMDEAGRTRKIAENRAKIKQAATAGTGYQADVESLYYGNQYFVFVYENFTDVRLVGAPPSAIGKFGGDTDNWMWPRHTGDFSLFRIYADRNNRPAPYAADNVPYRPKQSFTISTKGFDEGDFTLVYGYPARSTEYLFSEAARYIAEKSNPARVRLRSIRLGIIGEEVKKDRSVRIQYASKQALIANAWKKWQGEAKGIIRLNTVAKKQALEADFAAWAAGRPEYAAVIPQFARLYKEIEEVALARDYHTETFNAIELLRFAGQFHLLTDTRSSLSDAEKTARLTEHSAAFFKDYFSTIDRRTFVALLDEYRQQVADKYQPDAFRQALKKHRGNLQQWADELFDQSLFASPEKVAGLLQASAKSRAGQLANDPAYILFGAANNTYITSIYTEYRRLNDEIELLYRTYMQGLMEMQAGKVFYPDANFTLRVASGEVGGYTPFDGAYYKPVSTIEGIMEKDNPDIYDYNVPQRLRELYAAKDYGRWGTGGTVPVAFLANNHTTGGNSGSPVLNARGELIGVNFDRTWETTMSDIEYDPEICRNIALDIRYALFIIDRFAGAGYLLNELRFAE